MASTSEPIEWVGFDDARSIEEKIKYIIKKRLGGAMLWSLGKFLRPSRVKRKT